MSTKTINTVVDFTLVGSQTVDSTISTATAITSSAGATHVMIQAFTADVYFTLDGTTPTSANGFVLSSSAVAPTIIPLNNGIELNVISATGEVRYQFLVTGS